MKLELDQSGFAEFRADHAKRTISGLVVPWGKVAKSGFSKWRFARGSLHWSAVSRVKLNLQHEHTQLVGVATALQDSARGLLGTFKVARIPEGDRALSMAMEDVLDGFSIEVDFDDEARDGWEQDPDDASVRLVHRATLRGVALTGMPAYDDARADAVAASRDRALPSIRLTADELEGVQLAADQAGVSVSEVVRRGLNAYTNPRPVYSLGVGRSDHPHSIVKDLWTLRDGGGDSYEAEARWHAHRQYQQRLSAQFATVTTSTASQVIPPGYQPLIASIEADRPLFAAATKAEITNATPFTVPANITEASIATGAATHVEGTNPTDMTLTFPSTVTVTPTGISGLCKVTREIADVSSPAIDAVAFSVMREDFVRESEGRVFTELNGANGQGGTITGDTVPSGAMARTSAGAALVADLRKAILLFGEYRKARARSVIASTRGTVSSNLDGLDDASVPAGSEDVAAVKGCGVRMSPFITGTAAGDGDVFILGSGDLWVWFSPLLEFRYAERSGPAGLDLAIYGYFATRLIKPQGLASIRHT